MRVSITREGLRFALLLGVVGFAAYNNQNNVLYLMLSMGIASVVVSFLLGGLSLARIGFEDSEQPEAFADAGFRERVTLRNRARLLGAFGVRLEEGGAVLPYLGPGQTGEGFVRRLYRRRGVYVGEPLSVTTRFPLGLFGWTCRLRARRELTVFPRIRSLDPSFLARLRGNTSHRADQRGRGEELYRLRGYVVGDYVRHVHWKATARAGELIVREFGAGHDERLCLALGSALPENEDHASFEQLVTAAASLAAEWARAGVAFRFLVDEVELPPRTGAAHRVEVLTQLSIVKPRRTLEPAFIRNVEASARNGERVVLLGIGPAGALADLVLSAAPGDILSHQRRSA